MTATERVVDGWAADVERRARNLNAVIGAARRVVAEAFDTDPTPPHGIVRNHRKGPHT